MENGKEWRTGNTPSTLFAIPMDIRIKIMKMITMLMVMIMITIVIKTTTMPAMVPIIMMTFRTSITSKLEKYFYFTDGNMYACPCTFLQPDVNKTHAVAYLTLVTLKHTCAWLSRRSIPCARSKIDKIVEPYLGRTPNKLRSPANDGFHLTNVQVYY